MYQSSAGQIVSATTPGRRERPRSAHTTPLHFSLSLVVFHHVQKITLRVCYRLNTATIAEAHTRRASSSLHRRTTHVIRDVKQTTVAMAINNVTLPFVQPISPPAGIRLNSRKPQEEDWKIKKKKNRIRREKKKKTKKKKEIKRSKSTPPDE